MNPNAGLRLACIAAAILYAIVGTALFAKVPAVTSLWPWPDAGMSYVFLASIAAAIAAPVLWIGLTGEFAAFAPIGLNAIVVNAGIAAYVGALALRGEHGLGAAIIMAAMHVVAGALLYLWARRVPIRDPRPMPTIVRWSFIGFAITLLATGTALILQMPGIFPWTLAPRASTVFGCIFLGAAVYFIYGVVRPCWAFAAGQLWGFLAYDIVLFVPYGRMLAGSAPAGLDDYGGYGSSINYTSLAVYLAVLALSTLLALYVFLMRRGTRIFGARTARSDPKKTFDQN